MSKYFDAKGKGHQSFFDNRHNYGRVTKKVRRGYPSPEISSSVHSRNMSTKKVQFFH